MTAKALAAIAMAAAGLAAAATIGMPALADTRAGVEAWQRGDYPKAVEEWRGPAIAGDADAQFNLGQAYKLGRGVPADLNQAEEWYRRAAIQGHPQAEENYGLALFQNNKRAEAVPWLQRAADRGEARAQFVLGTMYFNGDAVPRDWVRAYALVSRASALGLPQAGQALAQMDRYIALGERQQGLALARQLESQQAGARLAVAGGGAAVRPRPPAAPVRTAELPPSASYQPDPAPPAPAPVPAPVARPRPAPTRVAAVAPPPAPAPAAPARVVDGGWRVQLGAFGDPGNARRLWGQVGGRFPGRQVYFVRAGSLTKVLVGPFASNGEAARACGAVRPCVPVRG